MVRDNNYYFYLSGLISLSIFLLTISSFAYMMFSQNKINSYALKKDDYLSISLDMVISSPKNNSATVQNQDLTIPNQEENLDIDDLFSDVSTKEIKKAKPKKIDNKRYNEIIKKVKIVRKKDVASISDKIKSIESSELTKNSNNKASTNSTASEVNEYLAKIQATIYNHFKPPQNTQGKYAEVVIELSSIGKMIDFRILKSSDNVSFNDEVKKIKKRLQHVVFPKNPNNENYRLITKIISKE